MLELFSYRPTPWGARAELAMAIFKLSKEALLPLQETQLWAENILERKDLQRLLRGRIQTLDANLMVISEEFDQWVESSRRIDLLCIDKEANLVIVELKRTEDGGHMELQAIRYAAMISSLTFPQLVDAHKQYLERLGQDSSAAEQNILGFLQWDEPPDNDQFASTVRILLASADFSKELTTSVLWLNDQGLDIQCVRLRPYRDVDGTIFLDIQQLIPLPEATDYQTQIKAKERAGKAERAERHDLRFRFWSELLKYAQTKTDLHAGRSPNIYHWVGGSIGRQGFQLNYTVRERESQVELYIDQGPKTDESNLKAFQNLEQHRQEIEAAFDDKLEWQDLPESRACRIRKVVSGGYRSPDAEWPKIHEQLVDGMIRLDKAFRPFVQKLPS
jgi:hypothetical protein